MRRSLAWVALIVALFALTAVIGIATATSKQTVTFRVAAASSTGCGAFGTLTCHLVGTPNGQVYTVGDDSWIFVQVGHCYTATAGATINGLREVACS